MEDTRKKIIRSGAITVKQKELLVEFMQNHPELNSGKFSKDFTHKEARRLWNEVTNILNSCPNGSKKEWEQWRKAWQDLKKNTKAKASTITNHMRKTGGGEASDETLDVMETQIVDMLSPALISGHKDVPESLVVFEGLSNSCVPAQVQDQYVGMASTASTAAVNLSDHSVEVDKISNINDQQLQRDDHCYNIGPMDIGCENEESTASSSRQTPKSPSKRLTKSEKLKTSLGVSQRLVSLSEDKEKYTKDYYNQKLEILRVAEARRNKYEERKLMLLEKQINIQILVLQEQEIQELKTITSTYINSILN